MDGNDCQLSSAHCRHHYTVTGALNIPAVTESWHNDAIKKSGHAYSTNKHLKILHLSHYTSLAVFILGLLFPLRQLYEQVAM